MADSSRAIVIYILYLWRIFYRRHLNSRLISTQCFYIELHKFVLKSSSAGLLEGYGYTVLNSKPNMWLFGLRNCAFNISLLSEMERLMFQFKGLLRRTNLTLD